MSPAAEQGEGKPLLTPPRGRSLSGAQCTVCVNKARDEVVTVAISSLNYASSRSHFSSSSSVKTEPLQRSSASLFPCPALTAAFSVEASVYMSYYGHPDPTLCLAQVYVQWRVCRGMVRASSNESTGLGSNPRQGIRHAAH